MDDAIKLLKAATVPVFARGERPYELSIATANRLFRFSRPACVVQPETPEHVQAAVSIARDRSLALTIKCNGHSYAGHSTAFKDISLDLRRMNAATLDAAAEFVTVGAGAQWGTVYGTLVNGEDRHDGRMVVGGRCPGVGVAGFVLGGGLGPFTRGLGMGSDSLVAATLVTADAKLVTVSEDDDPKSDKGRLFWALRGAGGGNFGVVVQLKLRVRKLRDPTGTVVAGRYQWFPDGGITPAVIEAMNAFYTAKWPDSMTIDSTWICDLRQANALGGVRFTVAFDGSKREYDALINEHIKDEKLKYQLKRRALAEKSTRFLYETLVNQWLEETERAYPENKTYELFSSFVFKNDDADTDTIRKITAAIRSLMADFRCSFHGEQVNFLVTFIHSGGAAAKPAPAASAYFWREAVFHAYVTVEWTDKWMEGDMRDFFKKAKGALRPYSLNREAAFVNFPDRDFPASFHERAYFGANREELRRVKQIWDPRNFFSFAQGVRFPGASEDEAESEGGWDETDRLAREQWESFLPPPGVASDGDEKVVSHQDVKEMTVVRALDEITRKVQDLLK